MKIVTLLGSPKRHGNTASVLEVFEKMMAEQGHAMERINVIDHAIAPCKGCMACQAASELPGCAIADDGLQIMRRLSAADAVVYATPLYGWGVTAQMKPLLDRHWSMLNGVYTPQHRSALEGKRLALLVTCGGPVENNADLVQIFFDRMAQFAKAGSVHKYVVPQSYQLDPNLVQKTAAKMATDLGAT